MTVRLALKSGTADSKTQDEGLCTSGLRRANLVCNGRWLNPRGVTTMALIVVLVLLTIAIAAVMTFGDGAASLRFLRRIRLRFPRRIRLRFPRRIRSRFPDPGAPADVPADSWTELTSGPSQRAATMSFGAQDDEVMLVALLLAGRLSRRDYQQQMAQLAAEDSARGARP